MATKEPVVARTYTSFSGMDIIASINGERIGEIQGISYNISKNPWYKLGKRTITGTMVFIIFDRHALYHLLKEPITYVDEIPAFDISITGQNEVGQVCTMSIDKVQILTEGQGISVDDIISQQAFTFKAKGVMPWTPRIE